MEIVTAALLNTHLRDNLLETAVAKVSASGDLTYATAANALARLAIGSSGKHLVSAGGIPAWRTTPSCRVSNTSSHTLSSGAAVYLTFNVERYDTDGMHSTVTNSSRITCITPGVYSAGMNVRLDGSTAANVQYIIQADDSVLVALSNPHTNDGAVTLGNIATEYSMSSGSWFTFGILRSGANINTVVAGNYSPEAWSHWVGPSSS